MDGFAEGGTHVAMESTPLNDGALYPSLYRDLALDPARVSAFFPLAPDDPAAWRTRAAEVGGRWRDRDGRSRRADLCSALTDLHAALGPTNAQAHNLRRLADPEALVVVAGQQAGLLTGPLFTMYKAIGTIRRAAEAERLLGVPVVPVFWVASEDHDFSEVSGLRLADPSGRLVRFVLPGRGDGRSAGAITVPPSAVRLVEGFLLTFPPVHPTGDAVMENLVAQVRAATAGRGMSLAEWFTRQMHSLLGSFGLLFYDPMFPTLRRLAVPVLSRAADAASTIYAVTAEAADALRRQGYEPGLAFEEDQIHLFTYQQGRRVGLRRRGDMLCGRDGEEILRACDLAAAVERSPDDFSPDVTVRPVVQEWTLPVLAQLGGPGEVAYLAQLDRVFRWWDVTRPMIVPRPGATIVLPEDGAILDRTGIPFVQLRHEARAQLDEWLGQTATVDLSALFAAERASVAERYARLEQELRLVAPSLPGVVQANRDRVLYQLSYLERKAYQHRRRAAGDVVRAVTAAAGRLFPGGSLQERASNIYPYLLRDGVGFVHALAESLPVDGLHHRLLWKGPSL